MPEMVAPRALVFRPLVKGNEALGTRLCQPMKKFESFGATRATRQRHSKTSSTGDEDEWGMGDSEHAQSDGNSKNRGLPVLLPRGRERSASQNE